MDYVHTLIFACCFMSVLCTPQFSFIPSPNITILQSAVYQCTVTDVTQSDTVSIQWRVNGTSSTSDSWQSYLTNTGITVIGVDTLNSTLTIPGDPALNETTVTCLLSGYVNDVLYGDSDSAILYIQGPPLPVGSLQGVLISLFTVYSNWSIPYTIMGVDITGYNINITRDNSIVNQSFVTNTEYYYNVSQFGVYNISVAAVIGDELEGEINAVMVEVPEERINNWSLNISIVNDTNTYKVNCTIQDMGVKPIRVVLMSTSQFNNSIRVNYSLDIISYQNAVIIGRRELNIGRDKRDASIMVEYDGGLEVHCGGSKLLSTFNVQNLYITSPSNGEMCFKCIYISGINDVPGCYIILTSSQSGLNRSLTINNEDMKCESISETNLYHILVYDIQSNGTTYTQQPAYETSTMITGMSSTTSSATLYITPSSTNVESSPTTTPTPPTPPTPYYIIAIVLVVIVLLIVIVASLCLVYFKTSKRKTTQSHKKNNDYIETDNNMAASTHETGLYNTLNHSQHTNSVVLDSQPPLYNTLQHQKPFTGQSDGGYSVLPPQTSTFTEDSSNGQYSTLSSSKATVIELSYKFILDAIIPYIPHMWYEFGEGVAIIPPKLKEIEENNPGRDRNAFCDVIQEWQSNRTTRSFTWDTLRMVLKHIGEEELYMKVKEESML